MVEPSIANNTPPNMNAPVAPTGVEAPRGNDTHTSAV